MKIGIIGLGLIGGSIFKNLSKNNKYDVIGISGTQKGDRISNDYNTLSDCDFVFVCTPMNVILEILHKLNTILPATTIVSDVASLKTFVSRNSYNFKFVPSHPMAGTEFNGFEHSFPELFEGATWAITPIDNNIDNINILKSIITDLGAKALMTTPEEHDKAVAMISHAPMVVAQALCKSIQNNELAQKLASSGFRDTTRLALSNLEMANDMVNMNRENIDFAINSYKEALNNILNDNYKKEALEIKQFRQKLYQGYL